MIIISHRKIRLALDAAKATADKAKDTRTNSTPELWKGNDVEFEIGIFFDNSIVTDISNIASLSVKVKRTNDPTGNALMSKTITDLTGCTLENWNAGTGRHALVEFASAETNIPSGTYNLCCYVLTTDSPAREVTLGVTQFVIAEDGSSGEADSQASAGQAYTKEDADARYVQKHAHEAYMRFANGTWYHYEISTALWYPLTVIIQDGTPVLGLGEGVTL